QLSLEVLDRAVPSLPLAHRVERTGILRPGAVEPVTEGDRLQRRHAGQIFYSARLHDRADDVDRLALCEHDADFRGVVRRNTESCRKRVLSGGMRMSGDPDRAEERQVYAAVRLDDVASRQLQPLDELRGRRSSSGPGARFFRRVVYALEKGD